MQITVMSFNIRCVSADDGAHCWHNRREGVIDRIRACDPDLLGLQECRDDAQAAFIRHALPDYAFCGVRRGGEADIEMAPLLYRRAGFELLAGGHFWLGSDPGKVGERGWGAAYPRTASWVRLRARDPSAAPFIFLNTHFDYQGRSREESARLLNRWLRARPAGEGAILTGDFNAERDSETFRELTAGGLLHEALRDCGNEAGSFHDYGRAAVLEAIDWILATPQFRTEAAAVDRTMIGGLYPSDHYPVSARLATDLQPRV